MVRIYTDGACKGNGVAVVSPGGWAFAEIRDGEVFRRDSGREAHTTNNRMEMTAVIRALECAPLEEITVLTDSQYVIKGITEWMAGWKKKGWKTASGALVKNVDLWVALDGILAQRVVKGAPAVKWEWVRGHNGDQWNEYVDRMASSEAAGKAA